MPKFKTDIGKGSKAPLVKYLNRDNLIRFNQNRPYTQ